MLQLVTRRVTFKNCEAESKKYSTPRKKDDDGEALCPMAQQSDYLEKITSALIFPVVYYTA